MSWQQAFESLLRRIQATYDDLQLFATLCAFEAEPQGDELTAQLRDVETVVEDVGALLQYARRLRDGVAR